MSVSFAPRNIARPKAAVTTAIFSASCRTRFGARPPADVKSKSYIPRRLEALSGLFFEAPLYDQLDRQWDLGALCADRLRVLAEDRQHGVGGGLSSEGASSSQHLVHHATEAEDVATAVHRVAVDLLRGHVTDRADHSGGSGERLCRRHAPGGRLACRLLAQAGNPEVEDLHLAGAGDKNIRRFDVAVDNALAVCGGETFGDGPANFEPLAQRDLSLMKAVSEGLTLQQLGDRVGDPLVGSEIVDGEDVGMGQAGNRLRLPCETVYPRRFACRAVVEDLDRHVSAKLGVACTIDDTHATRAQVTGDLVATEQLPCYQFHVCLSVPSTEMEANTIEGTRKYEFS